MNTKDNEGHSIIDPIRPRAAQSRTRTSSMGDDNIAFYVRASPEMDRDQKKEPHAGLFAA
jgi:hypothetical protein